MANKGFWEAVYYSIAHSRTLTVRTYAYRPPERAHVDRILGAYLDAVGMKGVRSNLTYCLHELAANAKKANTKRLYFMDRGLDINYPADYEEGMRDFKAQTVAHIDGYLSRQKEAGLHVKFEFRRLQAGVSVAVINNCDLTGVEQERIQEKLRIARRYDCLVDAFPNSEDGQEGAGLGIVMLVFMLRNLGFGPDAFTMRSADGETRATLTLLKSAENEDAGRRQVATA